MRQGRFVPDDETLDAPARAALDVLGRERFAKAGHVLTSPLPRAVETAARLGLAATPEPAIRDAGAGRWAGLRLDQLDPLLAEQWLLNAAAAPPDGESEAALGLRVATWLTEVSRLKHDVLAVTHPAVVRAVLVAALGLSATAGRRLDVGPLTLAQLSWRRGWRLRSFGLPAAAIG